MPALMGLKDAPDDTQELGAEQRTWPMPSVIAPPDDTQELGAEQRVENGDIFVNPLSGTQELVGNHP